MPDDRVKASCSHAIVPCVFQVCYVPVELLLGKKLKKEESEEETEEEEEEVKPEKVPHLCFLFCRTGLNVACQALPLCATPWGCALAKVSTLCGCKLIL